MYLRQSASRAFTLLAKNPPLFGRTLLAKANVMRPVPSSSPIRCRFGDVVFEIDKSTDRDVSAMYFGASSPLVIDAMKRYLHPGDIFIDVGANIGYLSAIGASLVGPGGQVHSFEPVPRHYSRLRRLAELNLSHSIVTNPVAVGASAGIAKLHVTREPGQNTLVTGYKTGAEVAAEIEVPVVRLDSYIESHHLTQVALIKIDAEGFELPILEGLRGLFDRGCHPRIICEIAPRAYPLMGRAISNLSELLSESNYVAREIIDGKTPVDLLALEYVTDVLFLADC